MKLKPRFFLLTLFLIAVSGFAVWGAVRVLALDIIEEWAARYAEKQVLYDKSRTLQPVMREIALARLFADSRTLRDWALQPDDPQLSKDALAEMESYRQIFSDHSYFIALLDSGHYYYNNAANDFAGQELRYRLSPDNPKDQWFYKSVAIGQTLQLNVNRDAALGVTKLWINVLLRDNDRILGMAGTGLDLTRFVDDVVNDPDPALTSVFVDRQGAIQLHRDQSLIDFATVAHSGAPANTLDLLISDPGERIALKEAMDQLAGDDAQANEVLTRFVHVDGKRFLAGLAYISEIGWFEITLLDLDKMLPLSRFGGTLMVYVATLLLAMLLFNLALNRRVLRPLQQLSVAIDSMQQGRFSESALPARSEDEIGHLVRHFGRMARSVQDAQHRLEDKVRERTEALDKLSKTDALTGLLNRRGMSEYLESVIGQDADDRRRCGIIWLDLDHFKAINDRFGHGAGDQALAHIGQLIGSLLRPCDCAARWGGDEFLILLQQCDTALLRLLAERIRAGVADSTLTTDEGQSLTFSISAGTCLATPQDDVESLLLHADLALYEAKNRARNCVCHYSGGEQSAAVAADPERARASY